MARNFFSSEDILEQVLASSGESGSEPDSGDDFNDEVDAFSLSSSSDFSENDDESISVTQNQSTTSNVSWSWGENELQPVNFSFLGNSGIQVNLDENSSALDIFQCFLSSEMLATIENETNLYARQHPEPLSSRRHDLPFNTTTAEELKVFFACSVMMGVIKLPEIHLYWSTDGMTDVPFLKKQCLEIDI